MCLSVRTRKTHKVMTFWVDERRRARYGVVYCARARECVAFKLKIII